MTALAEWLLAFMLGMRHALEPDHLAAVSVLVSERGGARRGALLGAVWGFGHTIALFVVGIVLAALHARMPDQLSDLFEVGVAIMLIVLGIDAIRRARRQGSEGPPMVHGHLRTVHAHPGPPAHVHVGRFTFARRPLLVGIVHGLAGSGSLTAFVLAGLPSTTARLAYIALFGLGSVVSMTILSGTAAWPIGRIGHGAPVLRTVSAATGVLSTTLGVLWGWPSVWQLLR
jgi:ABC-type nickel/cobalt efflux system permease component RcnA